jgi:adenosylmethionine---8-amino-7-oxononanoate aminotransferase
MNLSERSRRAVWHPCSQMKWHESESLLAVARAQGAWLFDEDGRGYLDAISSWWVNLFGHNHPHINQALIEQLGQLSHVMLAGCTHEPVVLLSEKLGQLTGLGHAFYASDGAAAVEIALKMSRHYWRNLGQPQKCQFLGLAGGYHGETIGALSVTDIDLFRQAYAPWVRISATVPSPDPRLAKNGMTAFEHLEHCVQALDHYLAAHHQDTAAFIIEPLVQCAAGMGMYDAHYLTQARRLCTHYNVHLICDEIAVGFGRTGHFFAHQQAAIQPDLVCLSKGLTGGTLPLSVVLCTRAVFDAFYDDRSAQGFLHSHSYSGNPLACRAALATLALFETTHWQAQNESSARGFNEMNQALVHHPKVKHARHLGMIWAFDIQTCDQQFARRYHAMALKQGLLLRPLGNTLYFMPPYVMNAFEYQSLAKGALVALNETLASTQ